MQNKRKQLIAVVTGASSGIGAATAKHLAAAGYHVLAGVLSPVEGRQIADQHIEPVQLDITKQADIDGLVRRLDHDAQHRSVGVLINNAGVEFNAPFELLSLAEWHRQFDVNLFGQVSLTKALIPFLRTSSGTIINITSVGGRAALPNYSAYAATKFAFEGLSDALRRELKAQHIKVVIVEPGGIKTNMAAYSGQLSLDFERQLGKEDKQRYSRLIKSAVASQSAFLRYAMLADRAGLKIAKIAIKNRPRPRYSLGVDAKMTLPMVHLLPARWVDGILALSRGIGQ